MESHWKAVCAERRMHGLGGGTRKRAATYLAGCLPYFLGLEGAYSERDLEAALVANIEKFLLALGTDFCFVGRQYRIGIGGDDFYIDLVFYHRGLRAPVLVDLKVGRFEPADAAQMRLYLNWFRENDKREGENDPIGLILCGSKNEQVVRLLLANPESSADERIKVAQYLLLDSQEALRARLAQLGAAYERARGGDADEAPDGAGADSASDDAGAATDGAGDSPDYPT